MCVTRKSWRKSSDFIFTLNQFSKDQNVLEMVCYFTFWRMAARTLSLEETKIWSGGPVGLMTSEICLKKYLMEFVLGIAHLTISLREK